MHRLEWKKQARTDLIRIVEHIAQDSPDHAEKLAEDIASKAEKLREHPELYRIGRKRGTTEMVAYPHYIVIYRVVNQTVEILRVKHTARKWPDA